MANKTRDKIVAQAREWIGCKESNGTHKKIIDVYNSHKPLARGYKVKYTDAWCATFVSACAIKTGMTSIIPTECGCDPYIRLLKNKGIWVENDAYKPKAGDLIFYDWNDNGVGDNRGSADHVGIVEKVSNGKITVIEGNYSTTGSVARRIIPVNGRYIRGFGVPKYDKAIKPTTVKPVESIDEKSWIGVVTPDNGLNVRRGASTSYRIITSLPKGAKVTVIATVTNKAGNKWYKIKTNKYNGYVCAKYIKKA